MDDVYRICSKKIEHEFLSEVDMKKKSSINPGSQQVGVLWGDMLNSKPLLMILLKKV